MKYLLSLFVLSLLILNPVMAADMSSPVGNWVTIDDKTGKPKSIVRITQVGKQLKGHIVKLLNPSSKNPICDKCNGAKKDKPITGLEILWGLQKAQNGWAGGLILDPNNGKVYKSTLALIDGGKKLKVRGYIGIPLFGRSQTWNRQ